jgi:hypothetical protein
VPQSLCVAQVASKPGSLLPSDTTSDISGRIAERALPGDVGCTGWGKAIGGVGERPSG